MTSFKGGKIHVFDPKTHEMLFEIEFPGEVRPVALTGDESRPYVALSDFRGFVVADVNARKVIQRVELPALPPGTPEPFLKTYVHGLTLSPDGKELWVTSCAGAAVYVYSLPELKLLAKVPTGKFPHWFAWERRPDTGETPFDGSTVAHGSTFAHHPERKSRDRPERKTRDSAQGRPVPPTQSPNESATDKTLSYPGGWLLWVSQMESNQVSAIDPETRQVVVSLPTGPAPRRIVISNQPSAVSH